MATTSAIDATLERFAALDEKDLAQPWRFRDKPTEVRYALYRTIEDAQEAVVGAAAAPHPESRRILSLAQRAFGDLRGLLLGVPTDLLDRVPREGEWSVREILRHVIVIEGRYAVQTRYAVDRADTDPMRVADGTMPTPAQTNATGSIAEILARVAASHLIEHTVQCEKALAAFGWRATEGREIETRLVERSASSPSV